MSVSERFDKFWASPAANIATAIAIFLGAIYATLQLISEYNDKSKKIDEMYSIMFPDEPTNKKGIAGYFDQTEENSSNLNSILREDSSYYKIFYNVNKDKINETISINILQSLTDLEKAKQEEIFEALSDALWKKYKEDLRGPSGETQTVDYETLANLVIANHRETITSAVVKSLDEKELLTKSAPLDDGDVLFTRFERKFVEKVQNELNELRRKFALGGGAKEGLNTAEIRKSVEDYLRTNPTDFKGPKGPEGPPGEVNVEKIADILASQYRDELRGARGPEGPRGPAGPQGPDSEGLTPKDMDVLFKIIDKKLGVQNQ